MPRLFVAIPLPDPVRSLIGSFVVPIPGVRWVDPGQAHLTLHFLGEVDREGMHRLAEVIGCLSATGEFPLTTGDPGTFGPYRSPRVLWLGVEESMPLRLLHREAGGVIRSQGLPLDERPFHPHLTLARMKGVERRVLEPLLGRRPAPLTFPVDRVVLWESILSSSGALHRPVRIVRLEGGRGESSRS